jgi:hypothetical protein
MKRLKKGKGGNKQKEVIKTSNPSHCLVQWRIQKFLLPGACSLYILYFYYNVVNTIKK